ncbi:hypothetical protein A1O3_06604 [Capronia epimyces CBS 606.96]|uniref:Phytanoyl-CoA dioxygenase n=1 Tax=Capronia epimyces CBS 606.96 TaxID=1182542 RepID=W9YKK4_9EURO|nr:uncharacterized protein A1O3_06604 [Capronia epimyces CBS 606.96]EXJ82789.1 hypothetical protein A1O3_06604 [Capronia epimyces CBS 606.96]
MGEYGEQAPRVALSSAKTETPNLTHRVKRISRSAPFSQFIEAVEQDGCVIVRDFTDPATVEQANQEVKPWLERQDAGAKVGALGGKTRTVTKLVGRSPTVREKFFADPIYQGLCEHFLALETTHWYGPKPLTTTSHPLLSISITFDIPPGTPAQGLHRDDKNHHARHTRTEKYEKGRDVLLGLFVPGCNTSKANGATRIAPGSHLWGDDLPDFGPDGGQGVLDAEMQMGEAFIMLGSLYHGGGAYEKPLGTGGPESRTVHAMFSCTGVHRQEEISFLSYPIEEVKTYSKLVQERLGWKQSEPNLGWVDLKSPEFLLES